MEYFFGIIILLGALIFFHELGHFLVAKYCGVKVEVFSLGFGTKIFKKKIGETQYCLSLIPLGGYVKLYGEDPVHPVEGQDAKRSFSNQPVSKRIAIAAAGPIFNIFFAVFVYFFIEIGGLEKVVVPYLAQVEEGGAAWTAGLRPGDRMLRVNDKWVVRWEEDFLSEIAKYPDRPVTLSYLRKDATFQTTIVPESEETWNVFCEKTKIGVLKGISVRSASAVVGITDPNSWGAKGGFQTGDQVLALNGVKINYWYQLEDFLSHMVQADLLFQIQRGEETLPIRMTLPLEYFLLDPKGKERFLGIFSYEFFVREAFRPDTAGFSAGFQVGDRLVAINNEEIKDWDEFRNKVEKFGADPGYLHLTYDRGGKLHTARIMPKKVKSDHPCEQNKDAYQIGIVIDVHHIYPPLKLETYRQLNPFKALYSATSKSFFMMYLVLKSVTKMIQGKVSVKSMGGPILIGKIAGDHLKQGLFPFLALLAAISINLAILNLLPIPVLDGGHLFFFFCEAIFRKRPSEKIFELANRIGLVIILALVVLAFYNDLSRYWVGIISFLKKMVG